MLGARLEHAGEKWVFRSGVAFDAVPVTIRSEPSDFDLRRWLEAEAARPLPVDGALWRAVVALWSSTPRVVLLLILHHAITDGVSVLALVRAFEAGCRGPAAGAPSGFEPLPVPGSVEQLLPAAPGGAALDIPPASPAVTWRFEQPAALGERVPRVLLRTLGPDRVRLLHARAHAEKVTVSAAIIGALLGAAWTLPNAGARVLVTVPVDIRRRVSPPLSRHCALLISEVGLEFGPEIAAIGFWDQAREIERQISARLPSVLVAPPAPGPEELRAKLAPLIDPKRSSFVLGFVVTNLGALTTGPGDGPLRLKACRAIACATAGLAAFTIGLTTVDDHMAIIGYTEPLIASSSAAAARQGDAGSAALGPRFAVNGARRFCDRSSEQRQFRQEPDEVRSQSTRHRGTPTMPRGPAAGKTWMAPRAAASIGRDRGYACGGEANRKRGGRGVRARAWPRRRGRGAEAVGFKQGDISLLATEDAVARKLGHRYERVEELEDDPKAPRTVYKTRASAGDSEGMIVGSLTYLPAVVAAGTVVASAGVVAAAVTGTAIAGA